MNSKNTKQSWHPLEVDTSREVFCWLVVSPFSALLRMILACL